MTTDNAKDEKLTAEEQQKQLKYTWKQTLKELDLNFVVEGKQLKAKDFIIVIKKDSLQVQIKNGEVLAQGDLYGNVLSEDSTWTLDRCNGNTVLDLHLEKSSSAANKWWPHVLTNEPLLDTSKIEPENSKLSDLDGETRAMVEKMMLEQRQKAAGESAMQSGEDKKREMLAKFQAQHPEMDFSQAKIN